MKIRLVKLPLYVKMLIFFACTDIYLISGIKITYLFAVPMLLALAKRGGVRRTKENVLLLLWFASYFLSVGHVISWSDFIIVVIGQLVLFVIYFYFSSVKTLEKLSRIDYVFQLSLYFMVMLGMLQLILYYLVGSTWGISHITHGVGLPRSAALCLEPDWYGVICMMAVIFMLMNVTNKVPSQVSQKFF